jgi:hypothetical protein
MNEGSKGERDRNNGIKWERKEMKKKRKEKIEIERRK